jgi:hypothetical protein
MNVFVTTKNNLIHITHLLLAELHVKVNVSSIASYVDTHPQYPSLQTISDCLHNFKVPNRFYHLEKGDYWRVELPFPFITHSLKNKDCYILVQETDDLDLSLLENEEQILMSKQEFFNTWTGTFLVAEPDEHSGEPRYYQRYLQSLFRKTTIPLLIATFFSLIILIFFNLSQHLSLLFPLLLCAVLAGLSWLILQPLLFRSRRLKIVTRQLNRFRYNAQLFQAALRCQEYYEIKNELKPIQLGNPDGGLVLTIISNPFCRTCAKVHRFLEDWLASRDDLKIQIILVVSNHPEQKKVAQHMLALGLLKDQEVVMEALTDWYQHPERNYDAWARQYPVEIPRKVKTAFTKQFRWSQDAEVLEAPALLLNGYKVPAVYELEDFQHFIRTS